MQENPAQQDHGLHRRDARGTYRAPAKPGRNEPCECGSGRKSKKCHPDGLQPVVRRLMDSGTCAVCKKQSEVIPLRHEGLPGWNVDLCPSCVRDPKAVEAVIAGARSSLAQGAQGGVEVAAMAQATGALTLGPAPEPEGGSA
ncbi:MAG: SEC-C domain-containing protein [Halobacteriales archaeon]|nr:SEC-C domain-containing protein [Halobacteriales archaeon]